MMQSLAIVPVHLLLLLNHTPIKGVACYLSVVVFPLLLHPNLLVRHSITLCMASSSVVAPTLLLILLLACIHHSTCHLVKGSVSCLDCTSQHDLSGVKVGVRCSSHERSSDAAWTNKEGHFELELASDSSPPSSDCTAALLGGQQQLCSSKKDMVANIVRAPGLEESYTLAHPLAFFTSCPSEAEVKPEHEEMSDGKIPAVDDSKPLDFPPTGTGDLGLPPIGFLFRFFPIIGIP